MDSIGKIRERRRADRGLPRPQTAHGGDLLGDLVARQVPAGARLRSLPSLEVERLTERYLVEVPPEPPRRKFIKTARAPDLLFRQHPTLAGADPRAGELGTNGKGCLGLKAQRAEAHVAHEYWYVEA